MSLSNYVLDGIYLFSHSDDHRIYTLDEFQHYLIYPVLHQKVRFFYQNDRPIGVVTWAFFTDEEAEDFRNERWMPDEAIYQRDAGDQLWGIEFIAPFGHTRKVMRGMRDHSRNLYGTRQVHWRRLSSPQTTHRKEFK